MFYKFKILLKTYVVIIGLDRSSCLLQVNKDHIKNSFLDRAVQRKLYNNRKCSKILPVTEQLLQSLPCHEINHFLAEFVEEICYNLNIN